MRSSSRGRSSTIRCPSRMAAMPPFFSSMPAPVTAYTTWTNSRLWPTTRIRCSPPGDSISSPASIDGRAGTPIAIAEDDIVRTHEEAAANPREPLVVTEPLERFLDEHGIGSGSVEFDPIGEGHSNVTYAVRRGDAEFVLRRPPRPPLPPSAHDVLREAWLLSAVQDADVRTPKVLLKCDDESVIGAPFYVMERVEGDVIVSEL